MKRILLLISVLVLSGCIFDFDKQIITYTIRRDLAGKVTVEHFGNKAVVKVGGKPVNPYKYLSDDLPQFKRILKLRSAKVRVKNVSDTSFDAIYSGRFKDFSASIKWLNQNRFFTMDRTDTIFLYSSKPAPAKKKKKSKTVAGPENILNIKYYGTILDHNADTFDTKTNTMTWHNYFRLQKKIYFILDTRQPYRRTKNRWQ